MIFKALKKSKSSFFENELKNNLMHE